MTYIGDIYEKRSTEILEKLILSNSKSMEVKKLITTYRISLKTLRTDVKVN